MGMLDALYEHTAPEAIVEAACRPRFGTPTLTLSTGIGAVNTAVRIETTGPNPIALVHGRFRPHEVEALRGDVAVFNAGPRTGWKVLAGYLVAELRAQAAEQPRYAALREAAADRLIAAFDANTGPEHI